MTASAVLASSQARPATDAVVIVDAQGLVIWWSPAVAARLFRLGVEWTSGMTCCEALDCPGNTTPAEGCLTRSAVDAAKGLAPRPWSLAASERRLDATISARPFARGMTNLVIFEIAFAPVAAGTAFGPEVQVAALGRLSVTVGGRCCDGDWLQQRPGEVFRYLVASRSAAQRSEAIAGALWPERGPSAVTNVRYCIFKLRDQLGERADNGGSLVLRDAAGYRIDPRRLKLDADVFARQATAGITAYRRQDHATAETVLGEALTLYRGDFLADDAYADWAFPEREYLRALTGKSLAAMAQMAVATGRLVTAADHLQRLARLEPFDSHVHQMLIEVCLRRGRRTEALRHYHALRARLERAFGERPDFELTSVVADVANGRAELTRAPLATSIPASAEFH